MIYHTVILISLMNPTRLQVRSKNMASSLFPGILRWCQALMSSINIFGMNDYVNKQLKKTWDDF